MKKKGFTLIELLAVIVILAVIALIATPAVLNIIEDSKKAAAEASARNIASTAKTYYMQKIMEGETVSDIDLSGSTLTYDGDKATKGSISYDANGNTYGKMYVSGYCIEIKANGDIVSEKTEESNCDITTIPSVAKVYANGEAVYYNPVTNTKCTSTEAVSTTGTKTGCMKWYAFLDSENSNTVNLLLDHNTTAMVSFSSSLAQVSSDASTWNSEVKNTARIIKEDEIASIVGVSNWNSNIIYLHDGSFTTEYKGAAGTNKNAWLFDYTNSCTTYGCSYQDSKTYGYWTNNTGIVIDDDAWAIAFTGNLRTNMAENSMLNGVRPVITVNKKVLK